MKAWNLGAGAAIAGLAFAAIGLTPAQALTSKQCSAQYKAAKAAGTLNGMKYSAYRKAQCGAAAAAPTAAPATARKAPAAAPAAVGGAVFPIAVSPKYSQEKAGTARMHTCRDQYQANKAANVNGGLKWIQKGGGYYSQCSKRLKGA